jgi:hypothetical protein
MPPDLLTHRRCNALTALLAICILMGSASAARGAQLDVIPDGNGTVSRDPVPAGEAADCAGGTLLVLDCPYDYPLGQQVTLSATPNAPDVSFVGWSDARCPGTGACKLSVDADSQSITALFSPQPVLITIAGTGTVTTDAGNTCQPVPGPIDPLWFDCGDFPLFSRVALQAKPDSPTAVPTWHPPLCEPPAPEPGEPVCVVSVYGVTWALVGFGQDPGGEIAPSISVRFRILKDGTGAGTVRSRALDCGSTCATNEDFGQRVTLSAEAAPGSAFVGWRGACGNAPTCSLAVGPVTAVVGVFDAKAPSRPAAPPHAPHRAPSSTSFVAQMRRMDVSGHGRHRRILMRVQVNAPARVRARLTRGRRHVASWRWRVHAGRPLLRARVPARVRAGVYKLRLSFRPRAGHATHVTRRVRLPR